VTWRLSRGEKRLVSLAAVLAMEPEILLLDEPTAGLDEAHTARLIEILNQVERTLLIVSHDQPFLNAVTNRSLRLGHGKLSGEIDTDMRPG
jgi:cobalt/nickel transport system ATP-binding protein